MAREGTTTISVLYFTCGSSTRVTGILKSLLLYWKQFKLLPIIGEVGDINLPIETERVFI